MDAIYALHGFLGKPSDWEELGKALPIHPIDPLKVMHPNHGLEAWGKAFAGISSGVVMGYSMGARLALSAVLAAPEKWKGAVLISGHSGFKAPEDRAERLRRDRERADRFEKDPWQSLIDFWEGQPLFHGGAHPFFRQENDYAREDLAAMLRGWSLGTQQDLSQRIANLNLPILWVAGERDPVYSAVAKNLKFAHPHSRVWIAPAAGHRVPWDQPQALTKEIQHFLHTKDTSS